MLAFTLIALLLLSPVLKLLLKRTERPVIAVALDNSRSILLSADSTEYKKTLPQLPEKLRSLLGNQYEYRFYNFGTGAEPAANKRPDFSERQTDIGAAYDRIYNDLYNQNLGAVITITDGIYNKGLNPLFAARKLNAPFYNIALGDTSPRRDLLIKDVQYNRIVYSGNSFPLNIQVKAAQLSGRSTVLSVSQGGKTIISRPVSIAGNNFFTTEALRLTADKPGLQRYRVALSTVDGEINTENNVADVFIEVLESRKRVLMVSAAPHPDIAALRALLTRNGQYELTSLSATEFANEIGTDQNKLRSYQLVILHNLPTASIPAAKPIAEQVAKAGVPIFFIIGPRTRLSELAGLGSPISGADKGGGTNDLQTRVNEGFSLFSLTDECRAALTDAPPLLAPFGDMKQEGGEVLLWQKVGKVNTGMPLLAFGTAEGGRKTAALAGENFFKWPIEYYAEKQAFGPIDELFVKTVQYLSARTDNRLFRTHTFSNIYQDDERVSVEAELYDARYEPITNARIELALTDENGKVRKQLFAPRAAGYSADLGMPAPGHYTYTATAAANGKTYTAKGEFLVKPTLIEYLETTANHSLLRALSSQQGGATLKLKDIEQLPALFKAREDIRPLSYEENDFRNLLHYKWLFFAIVALLAAEWFSRKYLGGY